jgi:nucleotide-binding universal stress UspA family protein
MYEHILCAVDGSAASRRAVDEATELAERHDAPLTVLTVEHEIDSGELGTIGTDGAEDALQTREDRKGERRIEESVADAGLDRVEVSFEVVPGIPHRTICEFADDGDADLVVLGSNGKDSIGDYVLGSTSERVARRCETPVHIV